MMTMFGRRPGAAAAGAAISPATPRTPSVLSSRPRMPGLTLSIAHSLPSPELRARPATSGRSGSELDRAPAHLRHMVDRIERRRHVPGRLGGLVAELAVGPL